MAEILHNDDSLLTVTQICRQLEPLGYSLTPPEVNRILEDLGWQRREEGAWLYNNYGQQTQYAPTGEYYVKWSLSLLENSNFIAAVELATKRKIRGERPRISEETAFRTRDGHLVRSKAEKIIDNWLYSHNVIHAYEPRIPIEEAVYSDFYLPSGKVYIEYWGLEGDEKYRQRQQEKREIYKKYDFNLLELTDSDIQRFDDIFPQKLLKFGIRVI